MTEFCGSEFWNSSVTWITVDPYFTPCFESTVLNLIPAVFLTLFGIRDWFKIRNAKFFSTTILKSFTVISSLKAGLNLILILLQLVEICRFAFESYSDVVPMDYLSSTIQLLAHVGILGMSIVAQYWLMQYSGIHFTYWLLVAFTQGIRFRTALLNFEDVAEAGTKFETIYLTTLISYPIILMRLVLEFVNNNVLSKGSFEKKLGNPSPQLEATFISKLLLLWFDKVTWTGYRRQLTPADLWDLKDYDTTHKQVTKFLKTWNQKVEKLKRKSGKCSNPSVWGSLIKCFCLPFLFAAVLRVTSDLLVFVQPIILSRMITHVQVAPYGLEPTWRGYFYAAVIGITFLAQAVLNTGTFRRTIRVGMHARAALSNAVYRKSLVITSAAKRDTSTGELMNLQTVDSQRILDFAPLLGVSFGITVQVVLAILFLLQVLGLSALPGVAILLLLIPINAYLVKISNRLQTNQMKFKDRRLKLTSQVLNGIKVMKLYAWEPAYQDQIEKLRQEEIKYLTKYTYLSVFSFFMFQMVPALVSLPSFAIYVYSSSDNILTADKMFVSMNLFSILARPMAVFPLVVSGAIQTSVSFKRLSKFLNLDELDKDSVTHEKSHVDPIVVENATLSWSKNLPPTLTNINFRVKQGELIAIVGTVGSGKTSLLAALLGDMEKSKGLINTLGDIGYVSQSAWIQNATVRNNILLGDALDSKRYQRVIHACALETDFKNLDAGDQTEIGEKGTNLSGGQKQRVALARAAYKDVPVYLFDDPLSAVDSHVGKHIFQNLLSHQGILAKKTRILVTHAIGFLPQVDRILVMKGGEITEFGTYRELIKKKGEFAEFLLQHVGGNEDDGDIVASVVAQDLEQLVGGDEVRRRSTANRESLVKIEASRKKSSKTHSSIQPSPNKLMTDETMAEGTTKLSIIVSYFRSAGTLMAILMILFAFASQGILVGYSIWLSEWSTQTNIDESMGLGSYRPTVDHYMIGSGIIAGVLGILIFLEQVSISRVTLAASRMIHLKSLARVLRAPMSYFDTTPIGRLLNRFSTDIDIVDNFLPSILKSFTARFFSVIFSIFVICYNVPDFTALIVPITLIYVVIQRFYTTTSRQLKRLEGISRSPIFSHFGETISGASTIRGFRMEEDFIRESEQRVDENQKAYFPYFYSLNWLLLRLDLLGTVVIIGTCIFALISRNTLTPGEAGLAITYALQITSLLTSLARMSSDLEGNLVAVERVEELKETPQEASWENEDAKAPVEWPQRGQLVFEKYMTRYREGLDLVLTGISCTMQPGEKIGVIGRTGAGKSSLTLALFRLIESAGGKIYIDGVDISTLGLHALRKKITIIPQEPIFFSGSLRLNLDPFDEYSDEEVWRCLELAHLKSFVTQCKDGLYENIEEDGQNFSVGQRQLICLARALLRKTKILVLDEATAAVDLDTDELIQETVRREFADSTVISIQHRLNTILNANRVMVMDKGQIKEFDSPQALLADSKTIFWGMAKDANLI